MNNRDVEAQAGFQESRWRLSHATPAIRRRAAADLRDHGSRAIPLLTQALVDPEISVREAAAEALARIGTPDVLEPLCEALQSEDYSTRAAAARALGELGDRRAIGPLTDALRGCFMRGSANLQRWTAVTVALFVTCTVTTWLLLDCPAYMRGLTLATHATAIFWGAYAGRRRRHSHVCAAISGAFGKLSLLHPNDSLQQLAREMRSVSADFLLQERGARRAARDAATQIEALISHRRALPLAAAPPVADRLSLPRVSQAEDASRQSTLREVE